MLRSRLLTLVERNVVLRERHASYDQSRFAARHTQSKSVENYFLASWNTNCRPAFRSRYASGSGWIKPGSNPSAFENLGRPPSCGAIQENPVKALILDTQREIERLKTVVAETNLLLAHSRAVISTSRHFLAMLEHDRDARILSRNATEWTRSGGSEFEN